MANCSEHRAKEALKVQKQGSPEDIEAVKAAKKKAKDVLAAIAPPAAKKSPSDKGKKPIDHAYKPKDDREKAALQLYVGLFDGKGEFGVADKDYLLDAFKRFRKAETSGQGSKK